MDMEFHKSGVKRQWEGLCKECPDYGDYPFDFNQTWCVVETELLP